MRRSDGNNSPTPWGKLHITNFQLESSSWKQCWQTSTQTGFIAFYMNRHFPHDQTTWVFATGSLLGWNTTTQILFDLSRCKATCKNSFISQIHKWRQLSKLTESTYKTNPKLTSTNIFISTNITVTHIMFIMVVSNKSSEARLHLKSETISLDLYLMK